MRTPIGHRVTELIRKMVLLNRDYHNLNSDNYEPLHLLNLIAWRVYFYLEEGRKRGFSPKICFDDGRKSSRDFFNDEFTSYRPFTEEEIARAYDIYTSLIKFLRENNFLTIQDTLFDLRNIVRLTSRPSSPQVDGFDVVVGKDSTGRILMPQRIELHSFDLLRGRERDVGIPTRCRSPREMKKIFFERFPSKNGWQPVASPFDI